MTGTYYINLQLFIEILPSLIVVYFVSRLRLIKLFCESLWKPADSYFARVRLKNWLSVSPRLNEKIPLEPKTMKNGLRVLGYYPPQCPHENDNDELYYYIPRSIVFFKIIQEPWAHHYSSSKHQWYFFNKKNQKSHWEIPEGAKANVSQAIQSRLIWIWPNKQDLTMDDFAQYLEMKHKKK